MSTMPERADGVADGAVTPPRRTIYVDMTTAYQEQGRHPHGSTRVERGLICALAALRREDLRFCRFNALTGAFVAVGTDEAARIAAAPTQSEARREPRSSWRNNRVLRFGKDLESVFRTRVRNPVRSWFADLRWRSSGRAAVAVDPLFTPGSVLLLPGELQRQDFRTIVRLKRELRLDLVIMHYDLLGVLAKGDPRLSDPDSVDLPGTDFAVREAALLLSISRFSADILVASCAERGLSCPPVEVFRLGHDLPSGIDAAAAVAGLTAGRFVLAVGDHSPRKNFSLLIDVWEHMRDHGTDCGAKLVLVGRIAHMGTALVERVKAKPALAGAVMFLPNLADSGLYWLYANCRFTAFPSRLEGYGLPAAESLGFGKVCVASNATSIPEATQGAAILLDPDDRSVWRSVIEHLLSDDAYLRDQEQRVRQDFRPVTWHDAAADVLAAIAARLPGVATDVATGHRSPSAAVRG